MEMEGTKGMADKVESWRGLVGFLSERGGKDELEECGWERDGQNTIGVGVMVVGNEQYQSGMTNYLKLLRSLLSLEH